VKYGAILGGRCDDVDGGDRVRACSCTVIRTRLCLLLHRFGPALYWALAN